MIMEELSRASASIALSYSAHTALCMGQVEKFNQTTSLQIKNLKNYKSLAGEICNQTAKREIFEKGAEKKRKNYIFFMK